MCLCLYWNIDFYFVLKNRNEKYAVHRKLIGSSISGVNSITNVTRDECPDTFLDGTMTNTLKSVVLKDNIDVLHQTKNRFKNIDNNEIQKSKSLWKNDLQ